MRNEGRGGNTIGGGDGDEVPMASKDKGIYSGCGTRLGWRRYLFVRMQTVAQIKPGRM